MTKSGWAPPLTDDTWEQMMPSRGKLPPGRHYDDVPEPDPAEAMRGWSDAACRAVVEGMRAKCEEIARANAKFWGPHTNRGIPCMQIADEIAALKAKP